MMMKIKDIKKYFGGIKALDGCTLDVEKGKIIAIIGPNGSGKSTLFNVISQLMRRNEGSIVFLEEEITSKHAFDVARLGISRTFQEVRLFRNLSIKDHIEIAMLDKDESLLRGLFGREEVEDSKALEILDLVGLKMPLDTYATDLSYGQRKLLDLAIAIAKPHDLIMLDEPVAGINPKLRETIKNILRKLNKKGETILLIEHDMNFVMDLADYVYVLDYGKVIAQGKPREIQKNKKVLEAYLGE